MFRPNLSFFKKFSSKKFSTTVADAVDVYAPSVKFFHWTMGGSALTAVGKY
jgi:hypothetical protein